MSEGKTSSGRRSKLFKKLLVGSLIILLLFLTACNNDEINLEEYKTSYDKAQASNVCKKYGLEPLQAYSVDGETFTMVCIAKSPFTRKDVTIKVN